MMGADGLGTLRGLSGDAFDRTHRAERPAYQLAVPMAQMALPGERHEELRTLFGAIVANQDTEIARMRQWYPDWVGEPLPAGGMHMPGR